MFILDKIFMMFINLLGLIFIGSVIYVLLWLFMIYVKRIFFDFWGK